MSFIFEILILSFVKTSLSILSLTFLWCAMCNVQCDRFGTKLIVLIGKAISKKWHVCNVQVLSMTLLLDWMCKLKRWNVFRVMSRWWQCDRFVSTMLCMQCAQDIVTDYLKKMNVQNEALRCEKVLCFMYIVCMHFKMFAKHWKEEKLKPPRLRMKRNVVLTLEIFKFGDPSAGNSNRI